MEVFIDFGLFEILIAIGIAALARAIYTYKIIGYFFLFASIVLPIALIFMVQSETARWLSTFTLVTALVNSAVIIGAMKRGDIQIPKMWRWREINFIKRSMRNKRSGWKDEQK